VPKRVPSFCTHEQNDQNKDGLLEIAGTGARLYAPAGFPYREIESPDRPGPGRPRTAWRATPRRNDLPT